jgi:hypothetical protein
MSQEDGAARKECRVLCKKINDSAARRVRDDVFIAETSSLAALFSWPPRRMKLLIVKWAAVFELHRVVIASRSIQRRNAELIAEPAVDGIFFAQTGLR